MRRSITGGLLAALFLFGAAQTASACSLTVHYTNVSDTDLKITRVNGKGRLARRNNNNIRWATLKASDTTVSKAKSGFHDSGKLGGNKVTQVYYFKQPRARNQAVDKVWLDIRHTFVANAATFKTGERNCGDTLELVACNMSDGTVSTRNAPVGLFYKSAFQANWLRSNRCIRKR